MDNTEPILYFFLFALIMVSMTLMVRLSDMAGRINDVKEKIRRIKGEREEEPPEWL